MIFLKNGRGGNFGEGERRSENEGEGGERERGPTYLCVSVRVFSDHKKLPPEVRCYRKHGCLKR